MGNVNLYLCQNPECDLYFVLVGYGSNGSCEKCGRKLYLQIAKDEKKCNIKKSHAVNL